MALTEELLPKVKQNLILEHDADDALLLGCIRAALDTPSPTRSVPAGDKRSLQPPSKP